jgi:predicted DNA binding CopG/RHH family protein
MTITKKPSRTKTDKLPRDAIAEAFIQANDLRATTETSVPPAKPTKAKKASAKAAKPAAAETEAPVPVAETVVPAEDTSRKMKTKTKEKEKDKEKDKAKKKKGKKKEAVIIRFEDSQLSQIDSNAEALGLSRAAWVRMVVSQALAQK